MGATNALAAFDLYAGLVPPTSLLLLVRMALVSKDSDPEPWFGEGHAALARMAFGRGRHAEVDETDLKSVQRAMGPLRKIGAVTVSRPPAVRAVGHDTTKYQLHLRQAHAGRFSSTVKAAEDSPRRTVSVPREPASRSTTVDTFVPHGGRFSSGTGDEKRPPKETRGDTEETHKSGEPAGSALAKILNHPSAELAIVTDTRPPVAEVRASDITAAWVDHCRNHNVTLPRDLIGRYAKAIKTALDDGFDVGLIKRALARMLTDGQASWPGSFAAYLVRVQEQPGGTHRKLTPGEESAARLVAGADNPDVVVDAVQRFFERGAS